MFEEQQLIENEILCNILKIITVTFDILMSSCWINVSINK